MYYMLLFDFTINNLYFIQLNIGDKCNEQYYVITIIFIYFYFKTVLKNVYKIITCNKKKKNSI